MSQQLYLVGYDISDPKRQAALRYAVKGYSATAQQSAYECILSLDNKRQLTEIAHTQTDGHDRFFIIKTISTYWSQVTRDDISKSDNSDLPNNIDVQHFYIG